MNKIMISGNLIRDIEEKKTASGVSYVRNCVVVLDLKNKHDEDGKRGVNFIDIIAFSRNAWYMANYCKKGSRVEVTGRLSAKLYHKEDGTTINQVSIIVEHINKVYLPTENEIGNTEYVDFESSGDIPA